MTHREVLHTVTAHRQREGAGFIVRRPLPTRGLDLLDPFLLIDEMGPITNAPGQAVGAPDHPHRGFETVTYILEGEVVHEDSEGNRGTIGAGDVQWMTAGAGVIHSEMPSERLRREGGRMHGFQIWVNLPARDKMMNPRYQGIPSDSLPEARSDDGLARVRVVAGDALGASAVIETRTPITYQHWTLSPGADVTQPVAAAHNALVYVFGGAVEVAGQVVRDGQMALLGPGDEVRLSALGAEASVEGGTFLLLAGAPLREPVARYGPFVMNTREEIYQAVRDYQSGDFGRIERSA